MGSRFFIALGVSLVLVAGALILQNGWPGSTIEFEEQIPFPNDQEEVLNRDTSPAEIQEVSTLRTGENAVFISDQKPSTHVIVGLVALGADGFLVIHEDLNGKPGKVIGHSILLAKGEHRKFEIGLDRVSVDGETLHATLRADDGDDAFSPQEDKSFTDFQGNDIVGQFRIDTNAEIFDEITI